MQRIVVLKAVHEFEARLKYLAFSDRAVRDVLTGLPEDYNPTLVYRDRKDGDNDSDTQVAHIESIEFP